METITIILIFVGMFSLLVIWFITGLFSEKFRSKSLNLTLQDKLSIISAQNVALTALESEIQNQSAALRNLEEKCITQGNVIAALVEASAHGMLTVDSDMCIRHFNKQFCDMWDLSEENIHVGTRVYTILQHCMQKAFEPEIFLQNHHKINHSQDLIWNAEVHLSDNKIFQSSSSPIRGLDGTYYGRIWEFVDVTECIQDEQRLSEAYLYN